MGKPGNPLRLGRRDRQFESARPDLAPVALMVEPCFVHRRSQFDSGLELVAPVAQLERVPVF